MKLPSRKLGYWEELCQWGNDKDHGNGLIAAVAKITVSDLDLERLTNALRLLQIQQPLLRAKVIKSNQRCQFNIEEGEAVYLPFQIIKRTSNSVWKEVIELELNRPPRNQDYQWRTVLIYDQYGNSHEILLIAGHNIGDGVSVAYFFDTLFRIYQKSDSNPSFPLYPPVEELVQHKKGQKSSLPPAFLPTPIYYQNYVPPGERITKNHYYPVTVKQTGALLAFSKNHNFSLNALINALSLMTLTKVLDQPLDTTLHTPVNLRKWCMPVIPEDYFGCYVSVVTTYHKQVSIESDIIELARDYDHQLKQERLPGDAIFPVHHSKQDIIDALSSWEGHRDRFSMGVTVTNIGLLPFNTQYGHLKWEKSYFCTSRQNADIPVLLNVLTLNDQLMFCFTFTEPMCGSVFQENYVKNFISNMGKLTDC